MNNLDAPYQALLEDIIQHGVGYYIKVIYVR